MQEARKNVPSETGAPSIDRAIINSGFPLTRPDWDFNTASGKEHLKGLSPGLKGAAKQPTNLTKVREVWQGPDESPSAFLEQLVEACHQYTTYDPSTKKHKATVTMAFIDQAVRDIKRRLQGLEGSQDKSLRESVQVAEKVYHNRETEEEKEARRQKEAEQKELRREKNQDKSLQRILAMVVRGNRGDQELQGRRQRPTLEKGQRAYCKEHGHWARECPNKKKQGEKLQDREK